MIGRHRRPDRVLYAAPTPPELCEQGGLQTVLANSDLATASVHFGHCTACQREFVRLGGLLPSPPPAPHQTATRSAPSPAPSDERLSRMTPVSQRRVVPREEVLAIFATVPVVDADELRTDLDEAISQEPHDL
jgi:hypothetical protein